MYLYQGILLLSDILIFVKIEKKRLIQSLNASAEGTCTSLESTWIMHEIETCDIAISQIRHATLGTPHQGSTEGVDAAHVGR